MSLFPDLERILEAYSIDSGTINTLIPYQEEYIPSSSGTALPANFVILPSTSSAVDGYYEGFDIILSRTESNGTVYKQKRRIVAYSGGSKKAIVDDVWDIGYEPENGDAYEMVLSYPDKRVSINPPMQILDYVTSKRYGRGLNYDSDVFLNTWMESARKCDARSDVSLKLTLSSSVVSGSVYRLTEGSAIIFEGEVKTTQTDIYINFTNVIGKITNKWNSWKDWKVGDILYTIDNNFYKVTSAGVKATKPVHTSGTTNGLQFISALSLTLISGSGDATLNLDLTRNPVLALNQQGAEVSGYSLYDSNSVDYWRRLGWDEHSQSWATLYQTNFTIDTSAPLFDNINMMLEHCNGIFSYSEGKYAFDIKGPETVYIPINVEEDVIGNIKIDDSGNRTAYNSVTVSYHDPGNNFESRNISLYSAEFLKQDRNKPKKGNITVVGITNYYNVRLLADSYLKQSRYNLVISMTLYPEFIKLVPGSVVGLNYSRYSWANKPFRVETMIINPNGSIDIVAMEYNDVFYSLTNLNKTPEIGKRSGSTRTVMDSPSNLQATNTTNSNELKDGILLTWSNAPNLQPSVSTEIYSSDTNQSTLVINNITSNAVTFSAPHGLNVGSKLKALTSGNNIIAGNIYFVLTVVDPDTVTLSETLGGAEFVMTNNASANITLSPYTLIGNVSYPENSFLHTFPDIVANTIKYYKIRYKVDI